MNYDLCDALNRKLVKYHQFYDGNWTGKSGYKLPQDFDKVLGEIDQEKFLEYLALIGEENNSPNIYGHWIYRDGKLSGLVNDHETISKRILSEGVEHRGRGNATTELMNVAGIIKLLVNPGKAMYVECYMRPTLDQLLTLKDIERPILQNNGMIGWRILDRRGKGVMYEGSDLEKLHKLPWSKIK
jgi:hypothetical protein